MGGTLKPIGAARAFGRSLLALGTGALMFIGAPTPLAAQSYQQVAGEVAERSGEFRAIYAARSYRPLWVLPDGRPGSAVELLIDRARTAQLDGVAGKALRRLPVDDALRALRRAEDGDGEDVARAEIALSRLFADYVRATRSVEPAEMIFAPGAIAPAVPSRVDALRAAAGAESLETYLRDMAWMHPLYAPLREAMGKLIYTPAQRNELWRNMARVRALPALPDGRHVLVDTGSARLWMYENGKPVDSMRVVVGKPNTQTPTMAGLLRHAIVNPYWNVPPDLVQQNIAPNVVERGIGYLRERGYEVLSDYSERPAKLDPRTIKWEAVAQGTRFVRVRQEPGGGNFMGKVKYEFPNNLGIYLHDTPDKHLLKKEDRHLSAGCVRLEDAGKFGRWLLGKPLPRPAKQAEQRIEAPQPVPIYITHLTALPTKTGIAFRPDVYGREVQVASTAY